MSFMVELPPEVETRLRAEASRQGVPAADYALRLVTENLPPAPAQEADAPTWGARKLAQLRAADALGVWQERPETSEELAQEFQALAMARGPLPCR